MFAEGKDADEIAKFLKKAKCLDDIKAYIENITQVNEKVNDALAQLRASGININSIDEIINKINVENQTKEEIREAVKEKAKTHQLINTRTNNGNKGVAIMNEAASSRGDEVSKRFKGGTKTPDYIFKPR